jgi:hypothetical protein
MGTVHLPRPPCTLSGLSLGLKLEVVRVDRSAGSAAKPEGTELQEP